MRFFHEFFKRFKCGIIRHYENEKNVRTHLQGKTLTCPFINDMGDISKRSRYEFEGCFD